TGSVSPHGPTSEKGSSMPDLIPPHGGLTEPVSLTVPAHEVERLRAEAARLARVPVADSDLSSVYRFGDGGLSPLTGPMDEATYQRVLDECVIERGGRLYAWTIPIALPVTAELARKLGRGETVALTNSAGAVVATLAISDVYPWDKAKYLRSVYGTERTDHPGADMVLKGDADVRMRTYEALIETRALGEGDSDPTLWGPRGESVPDRVILLGLDIKMFYAGPKEAVMHGIYRQNFGFTDLVVGRKHADAPFHDGTPIWGDFDAQEIFDALPGDLKITPVKVGFAAYYESVGRVDLMDNHPGEKPLTISGKDVRRALLEGREVDPRIMRPSTARILAAAMTGG